MTKFYQIWKYERFSLGYTSSQRVIAEELKKFHRELLTSLLSYKQVLLGVIQLHILSLMLQ